ncbi:Rad52/Rad22 family DNA repair protein [Solibacillus sp. NPDC093137]|uniref:Rad52/Rad22 family DNA repair protein n=1 Tax=Solibacillus sp. NPDC093137 TaxID=3390678 RepID=UPI003D079E01
MSNSEQAPKQPTQDKEEVIILNQRQYLKALSKPIQDDDVEWKVQTVTNGNNGLKALLVPYVTSRAIMARLDEVFGLCWQDEYKVLDIGGKPGMQCTIVITDPNSGRVITKRSDAAELTHIEAIKGGYSDSLKRAAVKFGIGRFLYDLPQQWVQVSQQRIQGQKCEYVSGNYKVSGSQQFIKGYYVRPSVSAILGNNQPPKPSQNNNNNRPNNNSGPQGNNNQPQQTKSNQQQVNNSQQGQQPQHQKFTQTKGKEITPQEYESSVVNVEKLFQFFNYGPEHIAPIMKHISGVSLSSLRDADFLVLQKLFNSMNPVKVLMERSFSLGLEELEILQVVSQYMNEDVVKVSSLFGRLNVQDVQTVLINMQDYASRKLRAQLA